MLKNEYGTALIWAIRSEHIGVVQLLLGHKDIDVNVANSDGYTAVEWASGRDDIEELLSDYLEDQLIKASESGDFNKVTQLLRHENIDVNATNSLGHTALMLASDRGHVDSVRLLLGHEDIDVNAKKRVWHSSYLGY